MTGNLQEVLCVFGALIALDAIYDTDKHVPHPCFMDIKVTDMALHVKAPKPFHMTGDYANCSCLALRRTWWCWYKTTRNGNKKGLTERWKWS